MHSSDARPTQCVRCGGPLDAVGPNARCKYCGVIQPDYVPSTTKLREAVHDVLREDRNRNGVPDVLERRPPAPPAAPPPGSQAGSQGLVVVVVAAGVVLGAFVAVAMLVGRPAKRRLPDPVRVETPAPTPSAPAPTASATSIPTVEPTPVKTAQPPPKPALTPEQWGQKVVADAQAQKALRSCVEFDLWKNPNAPKAYTVTVRIGTDLVPDSAGYTFSPSTSRGFNNCARLAIFRAFNDARSAPKTNGAFSFATSFAFPNAQPNAGNLPDREWD